MKWNNISWILLASGLSLLALIIMQVNWLNHSRKLLETQFDQKVTMALCSAVDELAREQFQGEYCQPGCAEPKQASIPNLLPAEIDPQLVCKRVESSFERYDISQSFQFNIVPTEEMQRAPAIYCSSVEPITQEPKFLEVKLEGKQAYVIEEMGMMIGSSILLLTTICLLFGLTASKLLQQRKWNRLSVDFFNNMAHEFRTPLTNIQLAHSMAKRNHKGLKDDPYLEVISNESHRLLEQVERMLHVAKLEKGDFQLNKDEFLIKDFLSEIIADMKWQAEQKGMKIKLDTDNTEGLMLEADKLHLSNAIRNLLDNAIKYSPQDAGITVKLKREASWLRLTIADQGKGISAEEFDLLTEKFRRGQQGNIHQVPGFGLGLSYVKRIAELHGGKLQLDTDHDQGCSMSIMLAVNPSI